MDLNFLYREAEFNAFTTQHGYPLLLIAIIGVVSICIAKKFLTEPQRWTMLFVLSFMPFLGYLIMVVALLYDGSFDIKDDLPIHVCRILTFMAPIIIWKRNRFWMGIIYFWIIAGTLNANITPDMDFGFPHWDYFSYWLKHGFLVLIPLYYVIVLGIKINKKDLWNAFWTANLYMVFSLVVNYLLDSNYMYTMRKPEATTLLSYMGDWPWYLITTQLLALVLFVLVYLPFVAIRYFNKS